MRTVLLRSKYPTRFPSVTALSEKPKATLEAVICFDFNARFTKGPDWLLLVNSNLHLI